MKKKIQKQLELNLHMGKHGGFRPKAGRKRIHSNGVAHTKRELITKRTPQHINFKFNCFIKNKDGLKLLKHAIANARKMGLKIIHFSLQSNHVHLITEAENNDVLTRGMRALTITFAKGLRKGKVQIERYHLHVLKSIRETKNALKYVLFNQQKHTKSNRSVIDEFSTLFHLRNAGKMIAEFARINKVSLRIERPTEPFQLQEPSSFFLIKSLT